MMDVPSPSSHSNTLAGKRHINLVRCSTDAQTETSIPAQLELLNRFAAGKGMVHVDDVILEGISGSKPGARDDLQQILDRKRQQNDFDVLLVQTEDRLTRGGAGHGIWIKYELEKAGIRVVFASSDVPEGPYADIVQTLKFQAAQETVRSTSLRSTQGYQRALESRHVATSSHTPYGCHRLYCSSDDKALFLIKDNGDGPSISCILKRAPCWNPMERLVKVAGDIIANRNRRRSTSSWARGRKSKWCG